MINRKDSQSASIAQSESISFYPSHHISSFPIISTYAHIMSAISFNSKCPVAHVWYREDKLHDYKRTFFYLKLIIKLHYLHTAIYVLQLLTYLWGIPWTHSIKTRYWVMSNSEHSSLHLIIIKDIFKLLWHGLYKTITF